MAKRRLFRRYDFGLHSSSALVSDERFNDCSTVMTLAWTAVTLMMLVTARAVSAETWVEDSFTDFADGRLDASGQNLYVSHDGSVRTIHRFDLNQDGHLDLIFNSTHDRYTAIPATLASCTRERSIHHASLAVDGSLQVALSDLNGDGYLDAAFCPNAGGAQSGRGFVTILWGRADGWPAHRATSGLPVNNARRIATPDLNADGWHDLVILNGKAWCPVNLRPRFCAYSGEVQTVSN